MKLSYHSGLPMVNYMMSRTGINVGLKIAQFTANSFLPKTYLNDVDSLKPFLLLVNQNDLLTANEKDIIAIAEPIGIQDNIEFYTITVNKIRSLYTQKLNEVLKTKWYLNNNSSNVYCADSTATFFYLNQHIDVNELFENNDSMMNKNGEEIAFEGKLPYTDSLTVTFWGRSKNNIYGFPNLKLDEFDVTGNQVSHYDSHLSPSFEFNECTKRLTYTFKPKNIDNLIKIFISGKKYNYSNVVIQKAGSNFIFKNNNGNWFWNNYPSKTTLLN